MTTRFVTRGLARGTVLLALAIFGPFGCEEGPMEDAGEEIDDAAEDIGEELDDIGD
jgi:hypothetical protein